MLSNSAMPELSSIKPHLLQALASHTGDQASIPQIFKGQTVYKLYDQPCHLHALLILEAPNIDFLSFCSPANFIYGVLSWIELSTWTAAMWL